jgi:hypothetical protein
MKEKLDVSWNTNANWSGSTPLSKRRSAGKRIKSERQNVNGTGNE